MTTVKMPLNCRAVVSYEPMADEPWNAKLRNVSIRDIRPDECLVEIVASGICHTDLGIASRPGSIFPRVLGHEGTYPKAPSPRKAHGLTSKRSWVYTKDRVRCAYSSHEPEGRGPRPPIHRILWFLPKLPLRTSFVLLRCVQAELCPSWLSYILTR